MSTTEQRVAVVTGAARGIGAATAVRLAAEGRAVAVIDLDEAACKDTVEQITAAGGRALAVGCDVSDEAQVQAAIDRIAAELGAPTILVNNAGCPPRQPPLQDERVRLGHRHERAPAGRLPDEPRRAEAHGRRQVRPDRQPLQLLRPRQPRPGQLRRRQGRSPGPDQDPRQGAGQVRRHRQLGGPRLHRHRHDRRHRRACRHGLRRLPGGRRHPDPRPARRHPRRHRQRHRLLHRRRGRLRLRPGPVRGGGPLN